jgi:hypothetical protein
MPQLSRLFVPALDEVFHAEHVMINDAKALVAYCKVSGYDADELCENLPKLDGISPSQAGQIALAMATVQPQGVLSYDPSLDISESLDPTSAYKLLENYSKWSAFAPDPPHDFLENLAAGRVTLHYW